MALMNCLTPAATYPVVHCVWHQDDFDQIRVIVDHSEIRAGLRLRFCRLALQLHGIRGILTLESFRRSFRSLSTQLSKYGIGMGVSTCRRSRPPGASSPGILIVTLSLPTAL